MTARISSGRAACWRGQDSLQIGRRLCMPSESPMKHSLIEKPNPSPWPSSLETSAKSLSTGKVSSRTAEGRAGTQWHFRKPIRMFNAIGPRLKAGATADYLASSVIKVPFRRGLPWERGPQHMDFLPSAGLPTRSYSPASTELARGLLRSLAVARSWEAPTAHCEDPRESEGTKQSTHEHCAGWWIASPG